MEIITTIFDAIVDNLPRKPKSFDVTEADIWTDGQVILCPYEYDADRIADFLELFDEDGMTIHTGYFDPFEDAKNGEQDDYTGFWYVEI